MKSWMIAKAGAAGMARATAGRKTRFASKQEVMGRLERLEAEAEIEEALEERGRARVSYFDVR